MRDLEKYREKYHWLRGINLYSGQIDDEYNILEDFPEGWFDAFGEMMLEELDEAIKKDNLEDEFTVVQIKEKYGSLRFYAQNTNEEIEKIIEKYEALSENICIDCGKPDVYLLGKMAWILPLCENCFLKTHPKLTYKQYLAYSCGEEDMSEVMTARRFENGEWKEVSYSIKDTAEKIRKNWREKNERN